MVKWKKRQARHKCEWYPKTFEGKGDRWHTVSNWDSEIKCYLVPVNFNNTAGIQKLTYQHYYFIQVHNECKKPRDAGTPVKRYCRLALG